jgi:autotransporter-associated beta strand protein
VLVIGGGTLVLGNAANSYSGGTTVTAGSTVSVAADGDLGAATGGVTLGDATTAGTLATTGSFDSARTVTLNAGGGTIDVADGVTTGLTGQITGAGALTKTDGGTLILAGSSNYTGGTTVSGGTLQGTTDTLTGDITDNANVTFDQSSDGSYGNVLSGSGSLTKIGTGTLTLTGNNGYSGGTNVNAGGLSISSDANLGNGGTVALAAGTTLDFTAGGTYAHAITVTGDPTFNIASGQTVTQIGQITDATPGPPAGEVVVTGGGTLVLSNAGNSYSGGTTVTQGSTVSIATSGALGNVNGALTLGDATTSGTLATTNSFATLRNIDLGAGGGIFDTASGVTTILSGNVGGTGSLTKTGDGTLDLAGSNNHTGGTIVNGGTLEGTTVTLTGDITDNANVTFSQDASGSYGSAITGSGSVTKDGDGTVTFTAANGYTGATEIDGGTLQLGSGGSLASTTALTVNGSFDIENGSGQTVGSLSGFGSVNLGNGGLTVDQTSATTTSFDGSIGGAGGLTKSGVGTLRLTAWTAVTPTPAARRSMAAPCSSQSSPAWPRPPR